MMNAPIIRKRFVVTGPCRDGPGFVLPKKTYTFRFEFDTAAIDAEQLHAQFGDEFAIWFYEYGEWTVVARHGLGGLVILRPEFQRKPPA
jgi:hypothetical protein